MSVKNKCRSFRHCLIKFVFVLFFALTISSAANAASTAMFQFLRNSVSARLASLGGVSTIYPTDSSALYSNPSAGNFAHYRELMLGGFSYLNGAINSVSATSLLYLRRKNTAVGFTAFYNDSIHERVIAPLLPGEYDYEKLGSFRTYNLLLGAHFATMAAKRTSLGASLKLVYEKLLQEDYFGVVSDISLTELIDETSLFSVGVKNIGIAFGQAYGTPASGFLSIYKKFEPVSVVLEGEYAFLGTGELKLALELPVVRGFDLRAGFNHPIKEHDIGDFILSRITVGVGVSIRTLKIDYAFMSRGELGANHLVSVGVKL